MYLLTKTTQRGTLTYVSNITIEISTGLAIIRTDVYFLGLLIDSETIFVF